MIDSPPPQTPVPQDDPIAIAAALARLDAEQRAELLRSLPEELAVETFKWLDAAHQEELLDHLGPAITLRLVEALEPDDRARLLDQMPDELVQELLDRLSEEDRRQTQTLLEYPQESAGHIMSPNFLALARDATAEEALAQVRRRGRDVETIYTLPVLDERRHLVGTVQLEDLLFASPGQPVEELLDPEPPTVSVRDDQELVARLMAAADLLAVPVLDPRGRVAGIVTIDDAMDVLSYEEGEDMARTGAAEPLDRPYFSVSILQLARSRVVWLLVLVIAATLTVNVLSAFEDVLDQVVTLALFIPLLIGTGGNAGAQSATTIVRAMAVDQVRPPDLLRVILREALTGASLGAMLAVLSVVPVWIFFDPGLSVVIALSLLAICTLASLVGSTMPLLARHLGVDPAVVSAPFVTTIVDATGLLVYFLIARSLML